MKQCSKCREWKLLDSFYNDKSKKGSKTNICKQCIKKRIKKYRQTKQGQDKTLEYAKSVNRKKTYTQYNQSEKSTIASKKYYTSNKGKQTHLKYRLAHPEKVKANNKIGNEIRQNRLPPARSFDCQYCKQPAISYHHYKGYDKKYWFDVIPLCTKCHRKADRTNQSNQTQCE